MEDTEKKTLTRTELNEMFVEALTPKLESMLEEKVGRVMEPTENRLDEQQKEMKDVLRLLREAYNKDSRNKPFKDERAISKEALDYVEQVWRPMMRQGGSIDRAKAMEIIQKTTSTISEEQDDTHGGSTL